MRISVIGLGKLGAPMAAVYAARGHDVIGVDKNERFVDALAAGRAPVLEPQLAETIAATGGRLTATTNLARAVANSEITMIIVPTPSGSDGAFRNDYVVSALREIGAELRKKNDYHVVVVTSTVMPGSTGGLLREALETASGRTVGENVGLCYNPEFIALGSVVHDLLHPDFLLIGESDARAGDLLETMYGTIVPENTPVRRMNFVNAEITKIAVNTYVTTKISYANMIGDICDRLAGADALVVADAVGSDSRVGKKYLKPAVAYGGPCFPRDNVAFAVLADRVGARADLAKATDALNGYQTERILRMLGELIKPGARVAVLGVSYKPASNVIEESAGIAVCRGLAAAGFRVVFHDPLARDAAENVLGPAVPAAPTVRAALANVDAAVIMTPWPEYEQLTAADFTQRADTRMVVLDCWRLLPRAEFATAVRLTWLGFGECALNETSAMLETSAR